MLRPAAALLACLFAACTDERPLVAVFSGSADRLWLAKLTSSGAVELRGPISDLPYEGPVAAEDRLLLIGVESDRLAELHPRALTDPNGVEIFVDAEASSCRARFDGSIRLDVPVSDAAEVLREIDAATGELQAPSEAWARLLPRLRLRVPLHKSGCPRVAGPGRLVADLSALPEVAANDDTETRWGAYLDDEHFALMSPLWLFVVERGSPLEPRFTWDIPSNIPAGVFGGRAPQAVSPLSPSPNGVGRVFSIVGLHAGAAGVQDIALLELALRADRAQIRAFRELEVPLERLAVRADGAWAAVGGQRVMSATSTIPTSTVHVAELLWSPRAVALSPAAGSELIVASGERVLVGELTRLGASISTEFSELEETRALAVGATGDGSSLFFSSRSALYRYTEGAWARWNFALEGALPCPVLDRDECGRFGSSNGIAEIVAASDRTAAFVVNECPGVVIYDPVLDCGVAPPVEGGAGALSLLGATVWQNRVLLVDRLGRAFELIVE